MNEPRSKAPDKDMDVVKPGPQQQAARPPAQPQVMHDLDGAVERQEAQQLMQIYDFVMYQQGMSAGPTAAPLPEPGQEVLYQPPPANKDDVSQHIKLDTSDRAPPPMSVSGAYKAAVALSSDTKQARDQDPPTALLDMQPLPDKGKAEGPAGAEQHPEASGAPSAATSRTAEHNKHEDPRMVAQHARVEAVSAWHGSQYAQAFWAWVEYLQALPWIALHYVTRVLLVMVRMAFYLMMVLPLKLMLGPWYRRNRSKKLYEWQLLSLPLDDAQLQQLLGAVPTWLANPTGAATERLDWLNTMLAELWPILDPPVCDMIKQSVEPMLDQFKPPFISKMGFKRLTLGASPVVLEGLRVTAGPNAKNWGVAQAQANGTGGAQQQPSSNSERIELEVDFRWSGQPNIHFFVELALAGPYTRMMPRVSDLYVAGTMKVVLQPLLPVVPGFGAALVSFTSTPQIKFGLDFGPAMGGKFTAKPVAAFLDPFLRDTMAAMLVWPNRVVIPVLPESVTGRLEELQLRSVGVLQVDVLQARNLQRKEGLLGTVDPQIELYTQPQHRVRTAPKSRTNHPSWGQQGQRIELLVQEPSSQSLRVVAHDIEMLNVKALLQVNLLRGAREVISSSKPIGRASILLADVCAAPGQQHRTWHTLSKADWSEIESDNRELLLEAEAGEESDYAGEVELGMVYHPFVSDDASSDQPMNMRGVLFVDVRQACDLPVGDWGASGSSDPYVVLTVARQRQMTGVVPATTCPKWDAHVEFINVQAHDVLKVQVWDRDWVKPDDFLGELEIPVKELLTKVTNGRRGVVEGWFDLKPGSRGLLGMLGGGSKDKTAGRIELKIQFCSYML